MEEEDIRHRLIAYYRRTGRTALSGELQLPPTGNGDKSTRPDVVAFRKEADKFYLIECKKASRLRFIGHAFGQMLVTRLSFALMSRQQLLETLSLAKGTVPKNPTFEFGVAFPKEHYDRSESVKKIIRMFYETQPFDSFAVYVAGHQATVEKLHDGRDATLDELLPQVVVD